MSSNADDQARTITAIIGGCVVVAASICIIIVMGLSVVRSLRKDLETATHRIDTIQKDMELKRAGGGQIVTLEDLMKPYKKHLLQSAFDLQSRLGVQLGTLGPGKFLNTFSKRSPEDREYAISSTIYFFAEFLGWLEVIRSKVVFVTGSEYAESLNSLLDSLRYQLTGETEVQGCPRPKKGETTPEVPKSNTDTVDVNYKIMQLYIVDIRSIGNAMLVGHNDFIRPLTVDIFLQKLKPVDPPATLEAYETFVAGGGVSQSLPSSIQYHDVPPPSSPSPMPSLQTWIPSNLDPFRPVTAMRPGTANTRSMTAAGMMDGPSLLGQMGKEALAIEREKEMFNKIMAPLRRHIIDLTDLEPGVVPIRRLAIFQVLLCKLIAILDDAVPWDAGSKFDQNEEPRYIQRDIRLTPAVKFLSNTQKEFLRQQVFFQDDPSFSFPGFREDLMPKSQAERDDALWPGACPPMEPKKRPVYFKREKAQLHTQGPALASTNQTRRRRLNQTEIMPSNAGKGGLDGAPALSGSPSKSAGAWGLGLFSTRGTRVSHASGGAPTPTHKQPAQSALQQENSRSKAIHTVTIQDPKQPTSLGGMRGGEEASGSRGDHHPVSLATKRGGELSSIPSVGLDEEEGLIRTKP